MDKKLLAELVQSIKAAGKYVRGERKASRLFEYPDTDVRRCANGLASRRCSSPR